MTRILGIETSCDETSAAVIEGNEDGLRILSNVVASQSDVHSKYGGVFPEVASRIHVEAIQPVLHEALERAGVARADIDAIAVTSGPGLAGSLLVGVNFAKGLALGWDVPLVGVNHLEGHVYSLWLTVQEIRFPALVLIVSGGHTDLLLMTAHGEYRMLGSTLDDAAGEAFDKVARLLGLQYPGGPAIQKAAEAGNSSAYKFTRPAAEHGYDFSFSGLKTAVMRAVQPPPVSGRRVRGEESIDAGILLPDVNIADVAASFQAAAVDMLVEKTFAAARDHNVMVILMAGGVSANKPLREAMSRRAEQIGIPVYYPPLALCTDNAAMIAAAGYFRFTSGQRDVLALDVTPMLPIAEA